MTLQLFSTPTEIIAPGAVLLRGFADSRALLPLIEALGPFRHLTVPGGKQMSVAMTNCGPRGWISDRAGYRYVTIDPATNEPWPPMPDAFVTLARSAAAAAGYPAFEPDACLVNRYAPGTKMGHHQDKDERDFTRPIVSVSLGLPAVFLWEKRRIPLTDGDVFVFGGASRLVRHGVAPLVAGPLPYRYNLTFRRAR